MLNIQRTTFKVSDFLSWQRAGNLELNPNFQRRPVWTPAMKSYFIDTIVRGLPIPIIFIRERVDLESKTYEPKRDIVDGQQRLRTLISFIEPKSLKDFDEKADAFFVKRVHNKEIANKPFEHLPLEIKGDILNYQISTHVLPSDIGDTDVLQIFARMNASGLKLNDQELRNAEFFGEFKTAMYELAYAHNIMWRNWQLFTTNEIARMNEVEVTSDLSIFILNGITPKNQVTLHKFYEDYDASFDDKEEVKKRFQNVMSSIDDFFGEEIGDTVFSKKTIFYALFAIVYDQLYGIKSRLVKQRPNKLPTNTTKILLKISKKIEEAEYPDNIIEATTRRTTNIKERTLLVNYLIKAFKHG